MVAMEVEATTPMEASTLEWEQEGRSLVSLVKDVSDFKWDTWMNSCQTTNQ